MFETSTTEHLKYNLTKSLTKRNWTISLHFVKDDPQGMSPKIYGNNQPFIGDDNEEIEITINSIDLHDVNLVVMNRPLANVIINIIGASIYLSRSNFITLKQSMEAYIILQNCSLRSPYIIEGNTVFIDRYFWLDVEMNENSTKSLIMITNSTISRVRVLLYQSSLASESQPSGLGSALCSRPVESSGARRHRN